MATINHYVCRNDSSLFSFLLFYLVTLTNSDSEQDLYKVSNKKIFSEHATCSSTSVLYPSLGTNEFRHSNPTLDKAKISITANALTIKAGVKRGVEDVPFKLNPKVQGSLTINKVKYL